MHEAKSKLSQFVELAVLGEEVIIAKAGKPTVKLVPYKPKKGVEKRVINYPLYTMSKALRHVGQWQLLDRHYILNVMYIKCDTVKK